VPCHHEKQSFDHQKVSEKNLHRMTFGSGLSKTENPELHLANQQPSGDVSSRRESLFEVILLTGNKKDLEKHLTSHQKA
jgi:hypothetical protein